MNRLPVRAGAGFCDNIFHHFDRCIQLSSIFFWTRVYFSDLPHNYRTLCSSFAFI
jgi:hypothetical protein